MILWREEYCTLMMAKSMKTPIPSHGAAYKCDDKEVIIMMVVRDDVHA